MAKIELRYLDETTDIIADLGLEFIKKQVKKEVEENPQNYFPLTVGYGDVIQSDEFLEKLACQKLQDILGQSLNECKLYGHMEFEASDSPRIAKQLTHDIRATDRFGDYIADNGNTFLIGAVIAILANDTDQHRMIVQFLSRDIQDGLKIAEIISMSGIANPARTAQILWKLKHFSPQNLPNSITTLLPENAGIKIRSLKNADIYFNALNEYFITDNETDLLARLDYLHYSCEIMRESERILLCHEKIKPHPPLSNNIDILPTNYGGYNTEMSALFTTELEIELTDMPPLPTLLSDEQMPIWKETLLDAARNFIDTYLNDSSVLGEIGISIDDIPVTITIRYGDGRRNGMYSISISLEYPDENGLETHTTISFPYRIKGFGETQPNP